MRRYEMMRNDYAMVFKNVGNPCNEVITMTTNLNDFVVKKKKTKVYLRCPKREQFGPKRQKPKDLHLDEILHTSRNDCVQSKRKHMNEIASSKYEWFDHQMLTKPKGIRDEKRLF